MKPLFYVLICSLVLILLFGCQTGPVTEKKTIEPKVTKTRIPPKADVKLPEKEKIKEAKENPYGLSNGLYAVMKTSKGTIIIKLFYHFIQS